MADSASVAIGDNTPEQVAIKLVQIIGSNQGYSFVGAQNRPPAEWVLKNYAACLQVVRPPVYPQDAIELLP